MPVFLAIAVCCALPVVGAALLLVKGPSGEKAPERPKAPKLPAWRKLLGPGKSHSR